MQRAPRTEGASIALVVLVLVGTVVPGCADTRGPNLVVNSHIDYNKAVGQVLKEELLLNIVRRRYMEAPQFLNVSAINSNFTTEGGVGAGASVADIGARSIWNGSVDGHVTFSDSPTITITPRQGEDLATQLHEPIKVATIADLMSAGYPADFTLIMLAESINNLRGPDLRYDSFRSASPEWREAIALLQSFYEDGSLIIDRFKWNDPYNDYPFAADQITPQMWITTLSTGNRRWKSYDDGETFFITTNEMIPALWLDPDIRETPDGQRLIELLNVRFDPAKRIWTLETARVVSGSDLENRPDSPRSALKLRMRSLYNVLNLYAYGVRVPPDDEEQGRATDLGSFREAVARGEADDLSEVFSIRHSERPPAGAFQAVKYRGHWFYIDDGDFESKASFNALYDLWQLSIKSPAGEIRPVTTIQVN